MKRVCCYCAIIAAGCLNVQAKDAADHFAPGKVFVYESTVQPPQGGSAAVLSQFTVLAQSETTRTVLAELHVERATTVPVKVKRPTVYRVDMDAKGLDSEHMGLPSTAFDPGNHHSLMWMQPFEVGETTLPLRGLPQWEGGLTLKQTVTKAGDAGELRVVQEVPRDTSVTVFKNADALIHEFRREVVTDADGVKSCEMSVVLGPSADELSTLTASSRRKSVKTLTPEELTALRKDAEVATYLLGVSSTATMLSPDILQDKYRAYLKDFPKGIIAGWAEWAIPMLDPWKVRAKEEKRKAQERQQQKQQQKPQQQQPLQPLQ